MTDEKPQERKNVKVPMIRIVSAAFAAALIFSALVFRDFFFANTFNAGILVAVLAIGWGAIYAYSKSEHFGEMCCMMNGMVFSMVASFYIGTLLAIPSGDFIAGMIAGTIAGFLIGIPIGRTGGNMGRMEAVMAAPMGGAMGGMTGVMIRVYNLQLFMQFFFIVLVFMIYEITRMNYHGCEKQMSRSTLYTGIVIAIIAIAFVFTMPFSLNSDTAGLAAARPSNAASPGGGAAVINGVQEIGVRMTPTTYDPDYITVKKGIPVRINLAADQNAGCTRAIVFPDFNAKTTVPAGGTGTVEFTPQNAGTYKFRCSMGMAWGTLVVQ